MGGAASVIMPPAAGARPEAGTPVGHLPEGVATWCEIDLEALRRNVVALAAHLRPAAQLGIVVKGDAYGHGLVPCARAVVGAGADWLIVNAVAEAVQLRQAGIEVPLLICGPVLPAQAPAVVAAGADLVVYDDALVAALVRAAATAGGTPVGVHLKIETGIHRQGLEPAAAVALARRVAGRPGLVLRGLCTHLADVEAEPDHHVARRQWATLRQTRRSLRAAGLDIPLTHVANSAATLLLPECHADLVRVGVAAYGQWPSPTCQALAAAQGLDLPLAPVLSWRARVAQVKDLPAGAAVGYGRTWYAGRDSGGRRLAVLPVGYHEGFPRHRSNTGHVLIRGVPAPVRGRVCMNMTMVDVTEVETVTAAPVRAGEVATLIGDDGEARLTAATFADWAGTLHYEILSRIHPAVPRVHTAAGSPP